jgi:type III secretion system inner membrane ring protein
VTPLLARGTVLALCVLCVVCRDEPLLDNLDQRQVNETLAALQQRNIAASKQDQGKKGYAIIVSPDDFIAAVDTLSALDLPPRPRVEIAQAFPDDAMVSSPTAERARLLSMVEQRLEQTLGSIDLIDRASVHLSYALDDAAGAHVRPIHIAALVVHEPGADEQALIAKLKRFLKNAVADARYEDISITLFPSAPRQFVAPARLKETSVPNLPIAVLSLSAAALLGGIAVLAHWIRMRGARLRAWWSARRASTPSRPGDLREPT